MSSYSGGGTFSRDTISGLGAQADWARNSSMQELLRQLGSHQAGHADLARSCAESDHNPVLLLL